MAVLSSRARSHAAPACSRSCVLAAEPSLKRNRRGACQPRTRDRLRRAERPCRTLPGAGACFSMHSGPDCVPDTARFAVPVDIPSPPAQRRWYQRAGWVSRDPRALAEAREKVLAYRLCHHISNKRSLAGGALNAPYFLIRLVQPISARGATRRARSSWREWREA